MPAIISASRSVRPSFSPNAFAQSLHNLELSIDAHDLSVGVTCQGNFTCFLVVTGIDFLGEDLASNVEFDFTLHSS